MAAPDDASQRRQLKNLIAGHQLPDLDIRVTACVRRKPWKQERHFSLNPIRLMKSVLEEAAASLPEVASVTLTQAARGERDWMALKMAACPPLKIARTTRRTDRRLV